MQERYYANTPSLNGTSVEKKREELLEYFLKTYEQYEKLFELLPDIKSLYIQPNPQRHPLIFYYGHTATFFINKLIVAKLIDKRINPEYESIFAIGVDEMVWDDLESENYKWPCANKTKAYRKKVKKTVTEFIKTMPLSLPIKWEDPAWIILMGIEHERIHIETSSVLLRQLPIDKIEPHELWPLCPDSATPPKNELLEVPGGVVTLGRDADDPVYYGWDNEFGRHEAEVKPFRASKYLVTNFEYMEFVKDGGYAKKELWSEEGCKWVDGFGIEFPEFWVREDDGFKFRTMCEIIDMPLDWPAEVNYLEAEAYCTWLGKKSGKNIRLPSEDEWYRLREHCKIKENPPFTEEYANINLTQFASSTPVTANRHGAFFDVIGNVWQWTRTPIYPFEGFRTHPVYDDFTVPTFDGKHNLIKGGSWASTGNEILKESRFAFRRHFHQHAGFRYVEVVDEANEHSDIYETDGLISQYCEFHYGCDYFNIANFPKRAAEFAILKMRGRKMGCALDIGCSVGRSSFELARGFESVTGIDFSTRFIRHAIAMKEGKNIAYYLKDEGDIVKPATHDLKEFGLEEAGRRVEFWQGDACNLKPLFKGYDLVLAVNLIDRLYDPKLFLSDIHTRINDGGLLIIASPYTWQESSTKKEKWIGGVEGKSTLEGLDSILGRKFRRLDEPVSMEFVIRETKRKFQHTISEFTVWEKR